MVAKEFQPIVESIPEIHYSDENVQKIRDKSNELFESLLPKPEVEPEIIQVNDTATIYLAKPQKKNEDETLLPLIYYTHGGGLIAGNAKVFAGTNQIKADKYNAIVASIEYRLAPENPYPAAIDDVVAGLKWMFDHAEQYGIDKNRITIYGESAGGGLTAALGIYTRDKLPEIKVKNQILIYPMLDYKTSVDPANFPNKYTGEFIWTHASNAYGWKAYQGGKIIAEIELPYFSASHATDFSNLPNTFISFGSLDLFFEEDLKYIQSLCRAGNQITAKIINGAIHGFDAFPNSPIADNYNKELDYYLKTVL